MPVRSAEVEPLMAFPPPDLADYFDALGEQDLARGGDIVDLEGDRRRVIEPPSASIAAEDFELLAGGDVEQRCRLILGGDLQPEDPREKVAAARKVRGADANPGEAFDVDRHQTLNLKWRTSPSLTTYSLPSCLSLPASRAPASP